MYVTFRIRLSKDHLLKFNEVPLRIGLIRSTEADVHVFLIVNMSLGQKGDLKYFVKNRLLFLNESNVETFVAT